MAKYRIKIREDLCLGDKQCWDKAPETFAISDEDKSYVVNEDGNWPEYILAAAMNCPADAISLYDAETGEQVWPKPGSEGSKEKE